MTSPAGAQPRLPFPLQSDEQVIQLCHRHWWFLWPRTILWLVIAIAPVAAVVGVFGSLDWLDEVDVVLWPLIAVWLLFWGVRLLLNWYAYQRDIWVITNQRIVDSMQPLPWRHHLSTADLVNVQDITVEKTGIVATVLNFGDVICQTAGTGQQFRISGVPHPQNIQLLIDKERDRERLRHG